MAYKYINLSLFIFLFILEWYYFKFHSIVYQIIILSYSYPNFPPVIAGLDKGNFLGFRFTFQISVSVGGTVKSPKLISSPPDRVFLGGS